MPNKLGGPLRLGSGGAVFDDGSVQTRAVNRSSTHVQITPGVNGVVGNGTANDRSAIQDLIAAAGVGGTVEWLKPVTTYRVGSALNPLDGQQWIARNFDDTSRLWLRPTDAYHGAIIEHTGTLNFWELNGLGIGGGSGDTSIGIKLTTANWLHLRNLSMNQFGGPAIKVTGGFGGNLEYILATGACLERSSFSAYTGAIDIGLDDPILSDIEAAVSATAVGNGWLAAIVLRGSNGFVRDCVAEISEVGLVIVSGATLWKVSNTRADLNYGHGFIAGGSSTTWTNCHSVRNGRAATGTYDGFVVTNHMNSFTNCLVYSLTSDTNKMRHAFNDSAPGTSGEVYSNQYNGNLAGEITGSLYNFTGTNKYKVGQPGRQGVVAVTGTYTAGYGDDVILANASGGAFTVNLPTAAACKGKVFTVKRTSASNNVTVDPNGSETIDGATTRVLSTQYSFVTVASDGTNWSVISEKA